MAKRAAGKPEPTTVTSTETVRPFKKRAPHAEDMEATVPRKLDDAAIREREHLLAKKYSVIRGLEREKKRDTQRVSLEITKLRKEADRLADEITDGYEQVKQGDLIAAIDATPTPGQAGDALGKIAEGLKKRGIDPTADDAFASGAPA